MWDPTKKITHVQGQRRSPRNMVRGAKSLLEINPIPTRDTWRAQTNLVLTRTQRPHSSVQFSPQSCLTPYSLMDCSTPCLPVHHQLPRIYPNSCPLSQLCHPTLSSSVIPFTNCLQSSSASGSFQMSQLFASNGQSNGVSASTSVLPMNTQD